MTPRRKLGEILLSEGLIDEIQLRSAIGHQRNWGGKIGSTLVDLGFLREADIARVLEGQLKQHCMNEDELRPEPGALDVMTIQEAMKYEVFPLKVKGGEVTLAMCNPFDLALLDELGFKMGRTVKGVLAVESAIKKAIKKYYTVGDAGRDYKVDMKGRDPEAPVEIVHYEKGGAAEPTEDAATVSQPETRKVEPSPDLIAKALAYLLIEKGIIKRDELIDKMKALKDKGLG
jgi:hypothetical protein